MCAIGNEHIEHNGREECDRCRFPQELLFQARFPSFHTFGWVTGRAPAL